MIRSVLIANRGEIAIRIARSAADMGITAHMVFAPEDAGALHTTFGKAAHPLPGQGSAAYLNIPALIRIAQEAGCDAIHPGYGFLSERADFARACAEAGVGFIGPDAHSLQQLGDKTAARDLAVSLGVDVIPGSGVLADVAEARAFMDQLGDAILLKPVQGGGGRGMRCIDRPEDLASGFAQCQGEAERAFGVPTLYGEAYLGSVRHIEVQVIGDGQSVQHLWERDCSLQRRHQKLVELAPAPNLPEELRQKMLEAALKMARAVHYRGLGTFEFLVRTGAQPQAWFIEANPRIQVEHTVTEEITGLDLVGLQLRLAGGDNLSDLDLDAPPVITGRAVQLRINAERFAPDGTVQAASGELTRFHAPSGPGLRVDSAAHVGFAPHPAFDSLLAKVIVSTTGPQVDLMGRSARALKEFGIEGCDTNLSAMTEILGWPELADWQVDVTLIDRLIGARLEHTPLAPAGLSDAPDQIGAPMPGVLVALKVAVGEVFAKGQELALIEAMKMQHVIFAPTGGRVTQILANPGDVLSQDQALLRFDPTDDAGEIAATQEAVDPDHIRADLQALQDRLALTLDENRPGAVARRQARGQRMMRANIAELCAGGSFHEYGQLVIAGQRRGRDVEKLRAASPADGIITGLGEVNADHVSEQAAQAAILAYDASVMAGTQGMFGHMKTDRLLEKARDLSLPVVFFTEGGGGRPNDHDFADVQSTGLGVETFHAFARLKTARIAVNAGYCFAGNAAVFGAADIRIATRASWIGLGGPAMIEGGGLGVFSPKEIGPAEMQARIGGLDLLAEDEAEATALARKALGYFQGPLTDWSTPDTRHLRHLVPENRKRIYDMRKVIPALVDKGSFLELGAEHGAGMITGLIRMNGRPLGLIANAPHHLGGALDAEASAKGARFLRLCQRFGFAVLSLCDTPGFMVGPDSEEQGGVRAACDLLAAGADLDQPIFFVCLRKGYGIGAQAMAGGSFRTPAFVISWPTGEFGPMGLEGAVTLGFKKELEAVADPAERAALFDRLVAQSYAGGAALNVASLQEIDAVIDPADTRDWIIKGMALVRSH